MSWPSPKLPPGSVHRRDVPVTTVGSDVLRLSTPVPMSISSRNTAVAAADSAVMPLPTRTTTTLSEPYSGVRGVLVVDAESEGEMSDSDTVGVTDVVAAAVRVVLGSAVYVVDGVAAVRSSSCGASAMPSRLPTGVANTNAARFTRGSNTNTPAGDCAYSTYPPRDGVTVPTTPVTSCAPATSYPATSAHTPAVAVHWYRWRPVTRLSATHSVAGS